MVYWNARTNEIIDLNAVEINYFSVRSLRNTFGYVYAFEFVAFYGAFGRAKIGLKKKRV